MVKEELSWTFWSTETLNNNTVDFFQRQENATANGFLDQNMPVGGQFGSWAFKVHRIGVSLDADESITDAQGFANNSVLRLLINGQRYFEAPCFCLPAGGGITGSIDATSDAQIITNSLTNGAASPRALYPLRELLILPNTPFTVQITTTYNVNTRVRVILHGVLIRDKN